MYCSKLYNKMFEISQKKIEFPIAKYWLAQRALLEYSIVLLRGEMVNINC